jgi:hypothetical protein
MPSKGVRPYPHNSFWNGPRMSECCGGIKTGVLVLDSGARYKHLINYKCQSFLSLMGDKR